MYPPADDNYGVESCSIMMLGNSLISIATCGGTLYHCILLPNEEDDEKVLLICVFYPEVYFSIIYF